MCTCPYKNDQWDSEGAAAHIAIDSGYIRFFLGDIGMPTVLEIYTVIIAVVVNSSTGGANTIFC